MALVSINPATDEIIMEYEEMPPEEVWSVTEKTHQAFLSWRNTPFSERAILMKRAAQVLHSRSEEYARLMVAEMGKPITGARAEVDKCAWGCEYYADNAESFLQPEVIQTDADRSFVTFQPLGVILAVMPWNFPFWQVFRFAAPALMAGNTALLKHASNVPGCVLAIEDLFRTAGFPENVFRALLIGSNRVSPIIENPLVKAVTLTGSTEAGREVAMKAGGKIKKTVLELGGSDPYLIFEDADLETASVICADSRLVNSGQSCIAAKRFIVVESIRESFQELLVEQLRNAKTGDPLQEDTIVGPLARHDLRDELHRQVLESIEKGAKCLLGGKVPEGKGVFYPPTVLTDVGKGMPAQS